MTVGFFDTLLSPLYTAVSWIIVQFHSLYSLVFAADSGWAWGLSIVSLTILVRACMIPLTIKQTKSMRAMQALQPRLKAIQDRYKGDREKTAAETMKLYKENNVNPASSCLPLLIQSPFFMSLYGVLRNVADKKPVGVIRGSLLDSMYASHIFGAPLSATFVGSHVTNVEIVTGIMIATMCCTQFLTTRMMMTKNVDLSVKTPYMQQQKMMMYVLPIMYIFFGINMPVGVLVYMVTTNMWTLGQQWVIIHQNPTPGSVAHKNRIERLKAAGKLNADGTPVKAGLASLVKGGAEPVVQEAPQDAAPARRQQPKRQTKAQRQGGGSAGTAPADSVVQAAEATRTEAATTESAKDGQAKPQTPAQKQPTRGRATTGSGTGAQGGQQKRTNQPGKRSPQPAGQRPKKKS
jgi:YidC/Oxa1 family membrane protein insertase